MTRINVANRAPSTAADAVAWFQTLWVFFVILLPHFAITSVYYLVCWISLTTTRVFLALVPQDILSCMTQVAELLAQQPGRAKGPFMPWVPIKAASLPFHPVNESEQHIQMWHNLATEDTYQVLLFFLSGRR